jgi:hypothetical protein
LKAASVLVRRIVDRHLAKLPADTALTLAEPLQPYVKSAGGPVVVDDLRQHGAPSSFATRALRRVSAKRPVAVEVAGRGRIRAFPVPAIPGDTTSDPIARNLQRPPPARVNDPLIARQGLAVPIARGVAGFLAADKFADVLRARRVGIRIKSFQSSAWSARLSDTLKALPRAKADFTVAGRAPAETTDIRPVYRSPVIEEPLSSRMLEFAAGSILTDASRIPSDTVAMYAENRRFIEAFMVGANHEMNKELRWREFPTDLRGTIFRRSEPDHRVDGQGRQTRSSRRAAGDRPYLGHSPSVHRDQIRSRETIGDLVRIDGSALQHVGSNNEVARCSTYESLGDTAPCSLLGQLDQPMGLQRLQVIVHLLTGRPDRHRNRGSRPRFSQRVEDRGPDRIERHFHGGSVSEHSNIVHGPQGRP